MSSPFDQPGGTGDSITWDELKGALLLVEPLSFESQIPTSLGPKDAVKANVHVLDGPQSGKSYTETLIFPKVLCSQTKNKLGRKVLARLGQGNAKPGQSAPWQLNETTQADIAVGEAFLARGAQSAISSAAPPF